MTDAQLYHLSKGGVFKPCAAEKRACPLGSHLSADQLQSLGYEVSLTHEDRWRQNLQAYAGFRQQHGADPSLKSQDETELRLARWLLNSKQAARGTGTGVWSAGRTAAMDAINPDWNQVLRKKPKSGPRVSWDERYEQMRVWHSEHGRLPQIHTGDEEERVLGSWLNVQRQIARGNRSMSTPPDQTERLSLIDPNWNERGHAGAYRTHWQKRAAELNKFVSKHGRLPEPYCEDAAEVKLAAWMRKQRLQDLSPEQIMQLDAAAPNWSTQKPRATQHAKVSAKLALLRSWVESSPNNTSANLNQAPQPLRLWLATQRHASKIGKLDPERRNELDALLPQWDLPLLRGRPPGLS